MIFHTPINSLVEIISEGIKLSIALLVAWSFIHRMCNRLGSMEKPVGAEGQSNHKDNGHTNSRHSIVAFDNT